MFPPIPNTTHSLRVIGEWAENLGIYVERGSLGGWHFQWDVELDGRKQGRLTWGSAPHRITGSWSDIVVDYQQGGMKTHRLEFESIPVSTNVGDASLWQIRTFTVAGGGSLDTHLLSVVYSQTGEWFKTLEQVDYKFLRPSMIHSAIWASDDVTSPYLQEGITRGLVPVEDGWL